MTITNTDTICAIATANGVGSIAIVRISGDRAYSVAQKLTCKENFTPRHATLTPIYNADSELIDEAIIIYFKAPYSFSGEDIIEVQCHGGKVVADEIMQTLLTQGVRLAEPGEFSKRAFFNGKIDLSEAEAISKIIEAKSEDAAKILAAQMKGSLKEYIESIRDRLLEILAYSEVSIDYAEEDLPRDIIDSIKAKMQGVKDELAKTLASSERRKGLMHGFRVSIIGKPNVGKSSLLNAILDYKRAIVSDIAGTTRDTIEEEVKIGTHLIKMVDTAGIRESGDEIERIGIERSIEAIESSDIVIAMFDLSREVDEEDRRVASLIDEYSATKDIVTIFNKSDLIKKFDESALHVNATLTMNSKANVNPLIKKLEIIMDSKNSSDEIMLISLRQNEAVKAAIEAIESAIEPLEDVELEIFSFNITEAIHQISSITRPFENDEMLDKMFGSFCLGK